MTDYTEKVYRNMDATVTSVIEGKVTYTTVICEEDWIPIYDTIEALTDYIMLLLFRLGGLT